MGPSFKTVFALTFAGSTALGLTFATACKSRSERLAGTTTSATASRAQALRHIDRDLYQELSRIASSCEIDDRQSMVACARGDQRKLIFDFASNKRSRISSLPTLTAALKDPSPGMRTVGATVFSGAFRSAWGELKPGAVSADDARELLSAVRTLPKAQSEQVLPAAVHAAMLSAQSQLLFELLPQLSDGSLRATAVASLMTYGRLGAFPKVQELATDSNELVALAAVDSPSRMPSWTDSEQNSICRWSAELLKDPRSKIAVKAASLLEQCAGQAIDELLAQREKALRGGSFRFDDLTGLRGLCVAARQRAAGPTDAQCRRARALLEQVVESPRLDEQVRGSALASLAYQWPDQATLALAQRLQQSTPGVLHEVAHRTFQRLTAPDAAAPSP